MRNRKLFAILTCICFVVTVFIANYYFRKDDDPSRKEITMPLMVYSERCIREMYEKPYINKRVTVDIQRFAKPYEAFPAYIGFVKYKSRIGHGEDVMDPVINAIIHECVPEKYYFGNALDVQQLSSSIELAMDQVAPSVGLVSVEINLRTRKFIVVPITVQSSAGQ